MQTVVVSACRRRLRKVLSDCGGLSPEENGGVEGLPPNAGFPETVEHLQRAMEDVRRKKEECDKVRGRRDGTAVRTRVAYKKQVGHTKEVLSHLRESLRTLEKKVRKAEKKGAGQDYQQLSQEYTSKQTLISSLYLELEKLEHQPEQEMNRVEDERLKDAGQMIRAVRQKRGTLAAALSKEEGREPCNGENAADPLFDEHLDQVQKNRKEQEEALKRIAHGLGLLKERAMGIGQAIDISNKKLDEVEQKAERAEEDLVQTNRAAFRALEEASTTSYITNIACCLLLLAMLGIGSFYLDLY